MISPVALNAMYVILGASGAAVLDRPNNFRLTA
jgi:hypothetical protein